MGTSAKYMISGEKLTITFMNKYFQVTQCYIILFLHFIVLGKHWSVYSTNFFFDSYFQILSFSQHVRSVHVITCVVLHKSWTDKSSRLVLISVR